MKKISDYLSVRSIPDYINPDDISIDDIADGGEQLQIYGIKFRITDDEFLHIEHPDFSKSIFVGNDITTRANVLALIVNIVISADRGLQDHFGIAVYAFDLGNGETFLTTGFFKSIYKEKNGVYECINRTFPFEDELIEGGIYDLKGFSDKVWEQHFIGLQNAKELNNE